MSTATVSSHLAARRRVVWPLGAGLTYLNHGSYGSCPAYVLERQDEIRARMERDPTRFFKVDLEKLSDRTRSALSDLINAPADDIGLMGNGTVAMAVALNACSFAPGDEVVVTDHEYSATINELNRISERTGVRIVKAQIRVPVQGEDQVFEAVTSAVTQRTKLVVVSHIASASAIIFPVERISHFCRDRGIEVLLDGAHTPGQVKIDIEALAPTFYAASCHKWLNAPKGSGFLYAHPSVQGRVRAMVQSCRVHLKRARKSFLCDTDYVGTGDYTANLVIPDAIEHLGAQLPGGWEAIIASNHAKVIEARSMLCDRCPVQAMAPEQMIGTMASVMLPENPDRTRPTCYEDCLQDTMNERHAIQIPVWEMYPVTPRVMRISAQLYNHMGEYEMLAEALNEELEREKQLR
ncbi:MAG: aminotransferase class V-fold PLP-dependent enzyme [Leptolyngbya sp. PLA3]|nr:MAG: aminotransferase class V-fold PLP-dependent enzyme [Cyanobacteria bacterium CYA]MCE7967366.1 aminotransferase class V-fold PLP-dependent enzyme [Leptolyngbya sp. PL-A3]